jgi:hypothetical protein
MRLKQQEDEMRIFMEEQRAKEKDREAYVVKIREE